MGAKDNRTGRGFINPPAFHTDQPIFDNIDPSDSMGTGNFIQSHE